MNKPIPTDTDSANIGSDTDIVSVSVQPYYLYSSQKFCPTKIIPCIVSILFILLSENLNIQIKYFLISFSKNMYSN